MGILDVKEREKGAENLSKEIMADNFPNLGTDMDLQEHEAQRSQKRFNLKKASLRY